MEQGYLFNSMTINATLPLLAVQIFPAFTITLFFYWDLMFF